MKKNFSLRVACACLMVMILSSCASLENRLTDAAKVKGAVTAGIDIGALPALCQAPIPHAPLIVGQSPVSTLKRERLQLDKANTVIADCALFHDDLRSHLAGVQ